MRSGFSSFCHFKEWVEKLKTQTHRQQLISRASFIPIFQHVTNPALGIKSEVPNIHHGCRIIKLIWTQHIHFLRQEKEWWFREGLRIFCAYFNEYNYLSRYTLFTAIYTNMYASPDDNLVLNIKRTCTWKFTWWSRAKWVLCQQHGLNKHRDMR